MRSKKVSLPRWSPILFVSDEKHSQYGFASYITYGSGPKSYLVPLRTWFLDILLVMELQRVLDAQIVLSKRLTGQSQFCSQYDDSGLKFKRKEPSNSNEVRNSDKNFPNPTRNSKQGNIPRIPCQNINSGFVSTNGICSEVPSTSFEFYVSSEEGIDLFVDLSSSPSDWIRSLKNKVCISSEFQNSKSGALPFDLKGLGDSDGQMKSPLLGNTGFGFQMGGEPVSIKSSLGSIVGESLGPSAVIPTGTQIKLSGHVEENVQMVSSLCETNSNLQSNGSSPRHGEAVTLGLEFPNTCQINHPSRISSVSHKRGLPLPCEIQEAIAYSGSMEMQLSEVVSHCEDASNFLCLNGGESDLMHDLQTEGGESEKCEFGQNAGMDPQSAWPEERCHLRKPLQLDLPNEAGHPYIPHKAPT